MNDLEFKALRKKMKLTQVEMASLLGVDVKTVQNWESGRTIPKSKDGILRVLAADNRTIIGGQHVQNGDAINGDKIIEQIHEDVNDEKVTIKNMECDFENLMGQIVSMQRTIDNLVAQQSRFLTIIENMQNK